MGSEGLSENGDRHPPSSGYGPLNPQYPGASPRFRIAFYKMGSLPVVILARRALFGHGCPSSLGRGGPGRAMFLPRFALAGLGRDRYTPAPCSSAVAPFFRRHFSAGNSRVSNPIQREMATTTPLVALGAAAVAGRVEFDRLRAAADDDSEQSARGVGLRR